MNMVTSKPARTAACVPTVTEKLIILHYNKSVVRMMCELRNDKKKNKRRND